MNQLLLGQPLYLVSGTNLENKDPISLVGHVTVRRFAGYALPVPAQNKLLRSYCLENEFTYVLPLCELYLPENYMAFKGTIERCPKGGHIGMCSIYMFPSQIKKYLSLKEIIDNKDLTFHFIFEDKVIKCADLDDFYYKSKLRFVIPSKNQHIESYGQSP